MAATAGVYIFAAQIDRPMPYQSRRRNYLSRRERNARTLRTAQILILFVVLSAALLAWMNRVSLYNWFKTYFY